MVVVLDVVLVLDVMLELDELDVVVTISQQQFPPLLQANWSPEPIRSLPSVPHGKMSPKQP